MSAWAKADDGMEIREEHLPPRKRLLLRYEWEQKALDAAAIASEKGKEHGELEEGEISWSSTATITKGKRAPRRRRTCQAIAELVTMVRGNACLDCFNDDENCVVGHSHMYYNFYSYLGPALTKEGHSIIRSWKQGHNLSTWEKSHIFYGNDVPLSHLRIGLLKHYIGAGPPEKPLYVYNVPNSLVNIEKSMCKMVFSKEYTKLHLKQYLEKGEIVVPVHTKDPYATDDVDVKPHIWTKDHRVRLIMGSNACAIITTNWHDLVRGAHMRAGEMAIFEIKEDADDVLFINLASNLPMGGPVKG